MDRRDEMLLECNLVDKLAIAVRAGEVGECPRYFYTVKFVPQVLFKSLFINKVAIAVAAVVLNRMYRRLQMLLEGMLMDEEAVAIFTV